MSNSVEKLQHIEHEEIKRSVDLKDPSQKSVKMFVCEKHETFWIKPNLNRGMMK